VVVSLDFAAVARLRLVADCGSLPRFGAVAAAAIEITKRLGLGSCRWLLVRNIYDATPLPIRIQAPDRYSSKVKRYRRAVWPRNCELVGGAHVSEFAVG
jgi:hypothetical protein